MHGFDPRFLLEGKVRRFPEFLRFGQKLGQKPRLGPELIVNGTNLANTTGWTASTSTLSAVGGRLRVVGTSSGAGRADQQLPALVIGGTYEVRVDVAGTSTGRAVRIGTAAGGTQVFNSGALSTGVFVRRFKAPSATAWISLVDGDATGSNQIDAGPISVRRVLF